jgi:hypothetical protein
VCANREFSAFGRIPLFRLSSEKMVGMKILVLCSLMLVLGCGHSARHERRFVPVGESGAIALDTKTGQACWAFPDDKNPNNKPQMMPYCYDLYRQDP